MERKIKKICAGLLCVSLLISMAGCERKFDAAGYVEALLHLTFQGDTEQALQVIEGSDYDGLMAKYQESVDTFTANVITSQFDISEMKELQFAELVSKIFAAMRYEVTDARKTGTKEYEVSVSVQPADIFVNFRTYLDEDAADMAKDVKEGKYTGTEEEIGQKIMADIVNHAYELLDTAYSRVQYGEKETVILCVKANEDQEYAIDEEDMNNLMQKILRLDEM